MKNIFLSLGAMLMFVITAHAQNLYVSVNGPVPFSNGAGSISEYTPTGIQISDSFTSITSNLDRPRGLAFDMSGNLFVEVTAQNPAESQHARVLRFTSLGHKSVLGNAAQSTAEGVSVAIDGTGNVFGLMLDDRSPNLAATIYKFAPDGTRTVFGSVPGQSFGIAFDSAGNLYAADALDATIFKFTPGGVRTVFVGPSAFADGTFPVGLTFDSSGNLFVSTEGNPGNDTILEFTPTAVESTVATGLTQPRGLAFDASGNLFVAETRATPNGDILEFPTGGGAATKFAAGIDRPEFLAFGPPR